MERQTRWLQILKECRSNIQKQVTPMLKTLGAPQPSLGIGAGGDEINQIDLAAEDAIVRTVKKHGVSFTLISEESGIKEFGENPKENYVIADPVDGTTNLMRRIPFYATSIAVASKPILRAVHTALVADLFHGTTYTAIKGKGAKRGSEKIQPSRTTLIEKAVIGLDLNSYRVKEIAPQLTELTQRTKHVRHLGANALELCYVADGKTDAFIDLRGKLRTTDVAAAWLIVKEAKAEISTPEGKPLNAELNPKQKVAFIASANRIMHKAILRIIRSRRS